MGDSEQLARLRAYLEQHRATYTQEALRKQLLADGQPAQQVDLAIAQVYGFAVPGTTAAPAPPAQTTRIILIAAATFLVNYLGIPLLLWGLAQIRNDAALLLAFAPLLVELGAAIGLWRRNRTVARGLAWALAASLLPLGAAVLLFGICLALLGTM